MDNNLLAPGSKRDDRIKDINRSGRVLLVRCWWVVGRLRDSPDSD